MRAALLWQCGQWRYRELTREIRPLQILTGGNPRLLVIVAEFGRHRSLRRLLMEELVTLIDEHTEYFRGHLEVLAKTETAGLRLGDGPVATVERRRNCDACAHGCSRRIHDAGEARRARRRQSWKAAEGSGILRSPSERLYSIYYKLRRERDEAAIVENLVTFHGCVFYERIRELDGIRRPGYSLRGNRSPPVIQDRIRPRAS